MAEFCLQCWNAYNETQDPPEKYVFSWELELCEDCGEYKKVIVKERLWYRLRQRLFPKDKAGKKE